MTPPMRVPVYLLAGGRSSRFGSDKAVAMYQGRSLLEHGAAMVRPIASRLTVVAQHAGKYAHLGLRTLADTHPGRGPLAGLVTALEDLTADERWLLLCPCDAVVIRLPWLVTLLQAAVDAPQEVEAIAFRSDRWQPLPALYSAALAGHARQQIQGDARQLQHLLTQARSLALPLPVDWPDLWQVNRPEELQQLIARADSGEPGHPLAELQGERP